MSLKTEYAPEALLALFPKVMSGTAGWYQQHSAISDDVAMVTLGTLLSNRPELQEVAKVFSHVFKQMDVYLNLECKYTVGGKRKHTHKHLPMCRVACLLIPEAWRICLLSREDSQVDHG